MISILYLASTMLCIGSLLTLPRTHTKLLFLPLSIILQISILALAFGVLAFFGVGYSAAIASCVNIALSATIILFRRRRRRIRPAFHEEGQKEKGTICRIACRTDVVCYLTIAVITLWCAYIQFGPSLSISFIVSDPALHCRSIYQTYSGNPVSAQFFSYLFTVSLMSMWPASIPQEFSYYPFILGEVLSFALSGLMFYACMALYCQKLGTPAKAIITALYMLGYPFNSMLNGYSYLGMSITVIAAIVFTCKLMANKRPTFILCTALSLLVLGAATSYILFLPPLYLGLAIFLFLAFRREGIPHPKIFSNLLLIFIVPTVICLGLVYTGFFPSSGSDTVAEALKVEARSFPSFYSPFVFIAPLFIYGFATRTKRKTVDALEYVAIAFFAFTIILLALGMLQMASAYYCYKLYYALWLLFFLYTAVASQSLRKSSPVIFFSYSFTWIAIILLLFTGLDQKISEVRPRFNEAPASYSLLPIYAENIQCAARIERYDDEVLNIMREAADLTAQGHSVNTLMNDNMMRWDTTLFGDTNLRWWGYTDEELISKLNDYDYIAVSNLDPHFTNKDGHTFSETLSKSGLLGEEIYSNDSGAIYEVLDQQA